MHQCKTLFFITCFIVLPTSMILHMYITFEDTKINFSILKPNLHYNFLFLTVTGNANFDMNQTSFTLLGFTQPHSALPILQDVDSNAKGFTSRMLWYFPTPIYSKFADLKLTEEDEQLLSDTEELLGILDITIYNILIICKVYLRWSI